MTNFLTYWISRVMDTDANREAATRAQLAAALEGSKAVKARFDLPLLSSGYWTTRSHNVVSKGRHAEAHSGLTGALNEYSQALGDMKHFSNKD